MNKQFKWGSFLLIGWVLGFSLTFLFKGPTEAQVMSTETAPSETVKTEQAIDAAPATAENSEGKIFSDKGCLACHAVEKLGLQGGATAPDLSIAYTDTNNRFGKGLKEFLDQPEGTMSAVLGSNPLTEEEKQEIVKILQSLQESK